MKIKRHDENVASILEQMRRASTKEPLPFALQYGPGYSNTTRSKSYKKNCHLIDCGPLSSIVDINEKRALCEPRVTIESLVDACLEHGLIPAVVPEFKAITVGGAIMGAAAESSSFRYGAFNDACSEYEIILGDGSRVTLTPTQHSDLFFAMAGSYGSLGALTLCSVDLIRATQTVSITYTFFSESHKAFQMLEEMLQTQEADFLDGIAFSKNRFVVITAKMSNKKANSKFSPKTKWYFHHVEQLKGESFNEVMAIKDYLFRYDQGAFWMGSYLFKPKLLAKFFLEGVMQKISGAPFSKKECEQFSKLNSKTYLNALTAKYMQAKKLWGLLHKAEKWVQSHFIIQDFCVPTLKASHFFTSLLEKEVFPLWICPMRSSHPAQIFAPHNAESKHVINFGVYGLSSKATPPKALTRELEEETKKMGGRKVLYSISTYSTEEFWQIYPKNEYERLMVKAKAQGKWHKITDKVLSQ